MANQGPDDGAFIMYSPIIDRPAVRWPNEARLALWIALNVEHYEFQPLPPYVYRRIANPDVMTYSYRDSGNRVGFWRTLEVLDAYNVRTTASLNVAVLEHFPEVRDAMVQRDWDYMSHGVYNTRLLAGSTIDEEREFYSLTKKIVKEHTGKPLRGMLGPSFTSTVNTPALMAEAGFTYLADWFIDDTPFPINVPEGALVGVPYSCYVNDGMLFTGPWITCDDFVQMVKDQFDTLYAEGERAGRVMCISLHPFLIGSPHRIRYLDDALRYVLSHQGVWVATADEIADWYIEHHREEHLKHVDATTSSYRSRKAVT
jgi:peptidoglycan/xylan/chitin deacetylase (PgdA/CDA1 family)